MPRHFSTKELEENVNNFCSDLPFIDLIVLFVVQKEEKTTFFKDCFLKFLIQQVIIHSWYKNPRHMAKVTKLLPFSKFSIITS